MSTAVDNVVTLITNNVITDSVITLIADNAI